MNTAVFIPVRLGSSRLPEKPLIHIKGKSLIEHLLDRVKTARLPNLTVLCTTGKLEDEVFVHIAKRNGVEWFRGREHDILQRLLDAADKFNVDFIVNVDGDDVFCDPELIDRTVRAFLDTGADFIRWTNLPLGASPLGFKVAALRRACEVKDTWDTETGWGAYFMDTKLFHMETLEPTADLRHPEFRLTLDYAEDLALVTEIFERLYVSGKPIGLRAVVNLLLTEPGIADLNKSVDVQYWKRFKEHAVIKVKPDGPSFI
jgi:spore coat polysaccharide biosynthesis protein SpsF